MVYIVLFLILLAAVLCTLATILFRKLVKNPDKRKTWTIIVDALICLVMMGLLCCYLFRDSLFNDTKALQKDWIYENLPQKLWDEQTFDLADNEYKRLTSVMETYVNDQVRRFKDAGESQDLNEYIGMSMLGLDELYYLMGGSASNERKREEQIEQFKTRYSTISDNLKEYLSSALSLSKEPSLLRLPSYSDAEFCAKLLGTPAAVSTVTPDVQRTMAEAIVTNLIYNRYRPAIAACNYDRKAKAWNVRMDNAPDQVVQFLPRDDGDSDIHWTGNKGYVPPINPNASTEYGSYSDDEIYTPDPDAHYSNSDAEYFELEGFLETEDGKRYGIDMSLTLGEWESEADGYPASGSYHYASQSSDKQIELTGNEHILENGSSAIILETPDKTERFSLNLDRGKKTFNGEWRHFADKEKFEKGDYDKKYNVVLKYD